MNLINLTYALQIHVSFLSLSLSNDQIKDFITILWLTICMLTERVRVCLFIPTKKLCVVFFFWLKTVWNFFYTHSPPIDAHQQSLLRTWIDCIYKTGQMPLFFLTKSILLCQFVGEKRIIVETNQNWKIALNIYFLTEFHWYFKRKSSTCNVTFNVACTLLCLCSPHTMITLEIRQKKEMHHSGQNLNKRTKKWTKWNKLNFV